MRDWPAILADALARGVCVTALAREQGVGKSYVSKQASLHGVSLPWALPGRRNRDWPGALNEALRRGVGVSGLARHLGVSPACVSQQAQAYGIALKGQRYQLR